MKHLAIMEALKEKIAAQAFPDGKLPSEAALRMRFRAARETVRRALRELVRQGLVTTRNGVGTFVTRRGTRMSGLLGLLIPDFPKAAYFTQLKGELERMARRAGYRLVFEAVEPCSPREAARAVRHKARALAVQRIEGVIFRPFLFSTHAGKSNREVLRIFQNAEVPVVVIDADIAEPGESRTCDLVAVNNVTAGRSIAAHLLERGYRRPAYYYVPPPGRKSDANWCNRLFGLAGELALRGAASGVKTLTGTPDLPAFRKMLAGRDRPDVIVCANDETALRLIDAVRSLGLAVPRDIAVVGFDDIPAAAHANPPLTTVHQPIAEIARTALRTLLTRIRYPNTEPREINVSARLVARAST